MSPLFKRNWLVSQIGAREHYAIPRALERAGALYKFYTDVWCPKKLATFLQTFPDPLRSVSNRRHPDIAASKVVSFSFRSSLRAFKWSIQRSMLSDEDYYRHHINFGKSFSRAVTEHIRDSHTSFDKIGFFGYSTGSLETLRYLASTSCFTVVDQISPGKIHKEIVLEESRRWPGWAKSLPVLYSPFQERLKEEWTLASRVVVNSTWSKKALIKQGVPKDKIVVVPLAYTPPKMEIQPHERPSDQVLRVLWLGTVNLGKGIPYLLQAAKLLLSRNVRIKIVGPLEITEIGQSFAPPNVEFVGRVSRDRASSEYREADVFVLPTLSDGFAITQLEAMAHGLPVITTPNCGRVVRDETDGFIVPPRDAEAIANAIATLDDNRDLLSEMANAAYQTSKFYTMEHLTEHLAEALGEPKARPTSPHDFPMP